jgi:hypothetical protein
MQTYSHSSIIYVSSQLSTQPLKDMSACTTYSTFARRRCPSQRHLPPSSFLSLPVMQWTLNKQSSALAMVLWYHPRLISERSPVRFQPRKIRTRRRSKKKPAQPAHLEKRGCYHNSLLERSGKRVLPCN